MIENTLMKYAEDAKLRAIASAFGDLQKPEK